MIPFSSLESFTRESIRNRSFSDCLYSASTFAFADAGRVSSIKSSLYNSRFEIGVFVWWEMSAIKDFVASHMAKHKTPRYVAFVPGFPMNAAGKILKYKMREDAVALLNLQSAESIETA